MKRIDFSMRYLRAGFFNLFLCSVIPAVTHAQEVSGAGKDGNATRHLFIDVHHFEPGSINPYDVAKAHQKDLAEQSRHGVQFLKYWVNKERGLVYCLSAAGDSSGIRATHAAAHGLLPDEIYPVTAGAPAEDTAEGTYFLDIHIIKGVSATAVEEAHQKDLVLQHEHQVRFLNYWVNEATGLVFCLSKAKNADAVIATHRDAHGLLPIKILQVVQGE